MRSLRSPQRRITPSARGWTERCLNSSERQGEDAALGHHQRHELGMAIHSDRLLIVREGRVAHAGMTSNAATHAALREVFEQRISLHEVDSQWVVLPR